MPLLSIITPTYNGATKLEANLGSVLAQSLGGIEHIIIDNMSQDETPCLVSEYQKKAPYPVYYLREPDSGMYEAINKGLKLAKGEWTHILNSDDAYFGPEALSAALSHNNGDFDLIANGIQLADADGSAEAFWMPSYVAWYELYNFPHPGIILKKSFYEKYGYFDERYKIAADGKFGLLNHKKARTLVRCEVLVRMSQTGMSNRVSLRYLIEASTLHLFYWPGSLQKRLSILFSYYGNMLRRAFPRLYPPALKAYRSFKRNIRGLIHQSHSLYSKATSVGKPRPEPFKTGGTDKGMPLSEHLTATVFSGGQTLPAPGSDSATARLVNQTRLLVLTEIKMRNCTRLLDLRPGNGLVAFSAASAFKDLIIELVEPDAHIRKQLDAFTSYNSLQNRIRVHAAMWSDFAHQAPDSRGSLDSLWAQWGYPDIKVVIIEAGIEGLGILKMARRLLQQCSPSIVMLNPIGNLTNKTDSVMEMCVWLFSQAYTVFNLNGETAMAHSPSNWLNQQHLLTARPNLMELNIDSG